MAASQALPKLRQAPGRDGLTSSRHPGRIRVISVRVEDRRGILQRVTNLLGRRGFGIVACAVGASAEPGVVAMSLRIDAGTQAPDQIVKQLAKLIDVVSAEDITHATTVEWASALLDLGSDELAAALEQLPDLVVAQVVHHSESRTVVAVGGPPGAVEGALSELRLRPSSTWICAGPLALAIPSADGSNPGTGRDPQGS
ncbi:MAG: acetolactate synthase small subunit [Candidatus Dormiibacterota bacterium]